MDLPFFIFVIPGQRCLSLIQILGITFFVIRVFCPLCSVKYQLPDRHAGIYFYRARVDICHLKGDGTAEAGIDPAPGLVERYTKTGNARFAFDCGNDIIGQPDTFQRLGKHKLPGVEYERVCVHFTDRDETLSGL